MPGRHSAKQSRPEEKSPVCCHVYYDGVVHGVGFRYTARRLAEEYGVSGWVQNIPGSRVEICAQAEPSRLDLFLRAVRQEFRANISAVSVREEPPHPELRDFQIRFYSF